MMTILLNDFRCSNGHQFQANAKLRARCPECGASTKRSFDVVKPIVEAISKSEEVKPVAAKPVTTGPVLIRQGRPRMPVKKAAEPRKPAPKPMGAVSAGLVKSHTIKRRGVMPTIKGRPVKTAIARGIKTGHEVVTPYWHSVADKFGF